MTETSIVEIWKTYATNPWAGHWMVRNLYASQTCSLLRTVKELLKSFEDEDKPSPKDVYNELKDIRNLTTSYQIVFMQLIECNLSERVTGREIVKMYDVIDSIIDDLEDLNREEQIEKLNKLCNELEKLENNATAVPSFLKEEVSA